MMARELMDEATLARLWRESVDAVPYPSGPYAPDGYLYRSDAFWDARIAWVAERYGPTARAEIVSIQR